MAASTSLVTLADTMDYTMADDPVAPAITDDTRFGAKRLSGLLSSGDDAPGPDALDAASQAQAMTGGSLGDAMLGRLDAVGQYYRKVAGDATASLDQLSPEMNLQHLFRLQMEMATASLVVEVVSKGIAKIVQHVDQLTKLQ